MGAIVFAPFAISILVIAHPAIGWANHGPDHLDRTARRRETRLVVSKKALMFSAPVRKLGVNRCVDVPHRVVGELQRVSGKDAGPIRVRGHLNGKRFTTTIVRYAGKWGLYLNMAMRADAAAEVGDEVRVEVEFDRTPRIVPMPPLFAAALAKRPGARVAFDGLTPSHRKDILNYLNSLKTEESLERNIKKAIAESLAGRDGRRPHTRTRPDGRTA